MLHTNHLSDPLSRHMICRHRQRRSCTVHLGNLGQHASSSSASRSLTALFLTSDNKFPRSCAVYHDKTKCHCAQSLVYVTTASANNTFFVVTGLNMKAVLCITLKGKSHYRSCECLAKVNYTFHLKSQI